jgi:PPOX class probable F420-dependent enzyme
MTIAADAAHPDARIPSDAVREVLAHQLYAVLASRSPDDSVHAVPVIYLYAEGQILIATSSATRKARNIAARPDVTVTVEDRENLRWASAVGAAELVTGQRSRELNDRLYRRWMTQEGLDVIGPILAAAEDVTIAITPRRWLAWDIEPGFYQPLREAGIPLETPERWFLS